MIFLYFRIMTIVMLSHSFPLQFDFPFLFHLCATRMQRNQKKKKKRRGKPFEDMPQKHAKMETIDVEWTCRFSFELSHISNSQHSLCFFNPFLFDFIFFFIYGLVNICYHQKTEVEIDAWTYFNDNKKEKRKRDRKSEREFGYNSICVEC